MCRLYCIGCWGVPDCFSAELYVDYKNCGSHKWEPQFLSCIERSGRIHDSFSVFWSCLQICRTTNWGDLFWLIKILPIYSPRSPSISIFNPLTIKRAHMRDVHPIIGSGQINCRITIIIVRRNPRKAKKPPKKLAILSGFTENEVKPFNQSRTSLLMVNVVVPTSRFLWSINTLVRWSVVRSIRPHI